MKKGMKKINLSKEKKKESTSVMPEVIDSLLRLIPVTLMTCAVVESIMLFSSELHNYINEKTVTTITETVDNASKDDASSAEQEHNIEDSVIGFLIGYYTHYFLNS